MTVQADPLRAAGSAVAALSDALARGGGALESVPGQIKDLLQSGSWRHFVTRLGKEIEHDRFVDFVLEQPLGGLGATVELIERLIGTGDPELLRLWRTARKGKPGRKPTGAESTPLPKGEDSGLTSERLARDAPEEYEAVRRGEKTINAAAVAAGIRPHRIAVRVDRPESVARSLRAHMKPDDIIALAHLLLED